ncbi:MULTISPECIES: baseplate J/gp47 family protein [unclassified Borrelia]|uniref:baseplate J/gp47 family protein n=1 Tax=unclassified Borrelia TaxID=2649934 RepID=UPI001E46A054|nr:MULTISPECIES: baseplate J/gp47 family protein [unclassified Borrelia]UGQ16692.1 baseplate J/gp47 family protein [Borrelia sp. RT5S]UGQ17850.1 baseplate J/gp47 family protein [Borrelia sp. RT1S]
MKVGEEELRQFVPFEEQQDIREVFFRKAVDFGVDTNSNSRDIALLNLMLELRLDIRNETYSVGKNYDIRKSEGLFLDMEASKIGLRRKPAREARLVCKIIGSGNGEISSDTKFYYAEQQETQKTNGRLEYTALDTTKFTSKGNDTILLKATVEGALYNLEKGKLYTDEFITGLTHLEIASINTRGEDREDDEAYRARILREINGLTLRDTNSYYKRKLEDTDLIREVLIERKGVNNTKFTLRPHKDTTTEEEMKQLVLKTIAHRYEVLEKIDYKKAIKKTVNIKLKKKDNSINSNLCKARLQKYIASLNMGASFSLYDMYRMLGNGVNIIVPREDQTAAVNEYWEASISFED